MKLIEFIINWVDNDFNKWWTCGSVIGRIVMIAMIISGGLSVLTSFLELISKFINKK